MLKTNSKKAKENIWKYIFDDLDYMNEYRGEEIKPGDRKAMAAAIDNAFTLEAYNTPYEKRQNRQQAFEDWASGLALGGMFDYYYYNADAVDILGNILEETETERNKYTEEQAAHVLTYLIYREIENNK